MRIEFSDGKLLGSALDAPRTPETWVAMNPLIEMKVCGGAPDIIVLSGKTQYRHTPDGRLWKKVKGA
jgi:hypothetical protein